MHCAVARTGPSMFTLRARNLLGAWEEAFLPSFAFLSLNPCRQALQETDFGCPRSPSARLGPEPRRTRRRAPHRKTGPLPGASRRSRSPRPAKSCMPSYYTKFYSMPSLLALPIPIPIASHSHSDSYSHSILFSSILFHHMILCYIML